MGLKLDCPRCGSRMTLDVAEGTVECRQCGYTPLYDANAVEMEEPPPAPPTDLANVPISSQHEPTHHQEALFYRGMRALKAGERDNARRYLQRALEIDQRFTDAWLWLATTTDDPDEQREYLGWVLAIEPDHPKAILARAILEGRVKPEELIPDASEKPAPGAPVKARARQMSCPRCGGRLTYNIARGAVICQNCDYQKVISMHAGGYGALLAETLLKRKYQARHWKATERLLECSNCGAAVTLPARTMTDRCFFCNSQRVLVSDSSESFEQPDGIIPFSISERQAIAAVNEAMNSGLRALTRFLRDPISHREARGVYLPFWVFDAIVDVHWSYPGIIEHRGVEQVLMNDVLAAASHTLHKKLHVQIEPFDLHQMQRYVPRYLADWPAEVYQLDVDEASLNARAAMSKEARARVRLRLPSSKSALYEHDEVGGAYWARETGGDYYQTSRLQLSTRITGMTYRLVLLPVWSVLLHEKDGDLRRASVNGQTGKVALTRPLGDLL